MKSAGNLWYQRYHKQIALFSLSACVCAVYLFSLCPTVYLIDSGELAGVSWTLGIAHPTGYPLYTLISYFFAHLPGEPIKNLNILSAVFSLIALIFLYLSIIKITNNKVIAVLIASLYAFSPTIWRVSITNEVYPLTGLFCILLLYLLFTLRDIKGYYFLMFLMGLSFTNHFSIFSLALPIFFYLLIAFRPSLKQIIIGIGFSLVGISLYLYLLFRTQGGAELAWGNTCNLQRLFWHLSGRQYQVWMFSLTLEEIFANLKEGVDFLLRDYLYIFIFFPIAGFYFLFKNIPRLFWLFFIAFLLNLLYTINYAIPDIEPYYIPGLVALLITSSYGLKNFQRFLKSFLTIPIVIFLIVLNYRDCSLRNNYFGLDYAHSHIAQLPSNSLLICSYWDIYSPTIYLRKVRGLYKDLIIIDKELLRRTWYLDYLKREYPEFYQRVEPDINEYLTELYKFEYGIPYNPYTIQEKYIKMIEGFVSVKESVGVFFALPFPDRDLNQVKPDYYRIPYGLNYFITRDTVKIAFDFSKISIRMPSLINDRRLGYDFGMVKNMVNNNIIYLNTIKNFPAAEQARLWLKRFTQQ